MLDYWLWRRRIRIETAGAFWTATLFALPGMLAAIYVHPTTVNTVDGFALFCHGAGAGAGLGAGLGCSESRPVSADLPPLPENNVSPGHPLAELATLAAGLALVGFGLLLVATLAVEGAVRFLPPSLEQRAFGAVARPLDAADDARTADLDALLRRLSRHWPGRGYALHVATTHAAEPNAFALPGGNVLVTSGLLAQAGSENELAFVLGHELGHVEGRDPLRALGRGLLVALALAALGGSDGSAIAGSAAALGERAFSREQERAADRFALALVAAEYGHVAGASDFLRRLPDAGPARAAQLAAGWLSTHPRSDDRVAELEALARAEGFSATGALTPLSEALRAH